MSTIVDGIQFDATGVLIVFAGLDSILGPMYMSQIRAAHGVVGVVHQLRPSYPNASKASILAHAFMAGASGNIACTCWSALTTGDILAEHFRGYESRVYVLGFLASVRP